MFTNSWLAPETSPQGLLLNVFVAASGASRAHAVMSTECGKGVTPCLVTYTFHKIRCPITYMTGKSMAVTGKFND